MEDVFTFGAAHLGLALEVKATYEGEGHTVTVVHTTYCGRFPMVELHVACRPFEVTRREGRGGL
jgi:hypothetical protein